MQVEYVLRMDSIAFLGNTLPQQSFLSVISDLIMCYFPSPCVPPSLSLFLSLPHSFLLLH